MGVCLHFSKSFRCRFRDITLVGHFAHCRSKQHIVGSQQRVERVRSPINMTILVNRSVKYVELLTYLFS